MRHMSASETGAIYGRIALTEWIASAMLKGQRVLIGHTREPDGMYRGTIHAIDASPYRHPIVVCIERRKHVAHAHGDALAMIARGFARWVIACWGDLHEEYCKAHEIGDYEVFDERPEMCPSCHDDCFSLEFFPGSARGPAYSWVCDACNHHCFAASDGDAITIGEDEDGHLVQVVAVKVGERTIGPGSTIGEYRLTATSARARARTAYGPWFDGYDEE